MQNETDQVRPARAKVTIVDDNASVGPLAFITTLVLMIALLALMLPGGIPGFTALDLAGPQVLSFTAAK
ncbi:MAG TPA: hypothetical protein VGN79_14895 [Devosia sp.]|nr:hypothetical protein [Devosia sp.]